MFNPLLIQTDWLSIIYRLHLLIQLLLIKLIQLIHLIHTTINNTKINVDNKRNGKCFLILDTTIVRLQRPNTSVQSWRYFITIWVRQLDVCWHYLVYLYKIINEICNITITIGTVEQFYYLMDCNVPFVPLFQQLLWK